MRKLLFIIIIFSTFLISEEVMAACFCKIQDNGVWLDHQEYPNLNSEISCKQMSNISEDIGACNWETEDVTNQICICTDESGQYTRTRPPENGQCTAFGGIVQECKGPMAADEASLKFPNANNDLSNGAANVRDDAALQSAFENFKDKAYGNLNPVQFLGLPAAFGRAINMFLGGIGMWALVFYIWAGFQWMTAMGNSDKIEKAKDTFIWTSFGLGALLASYIIVSFIFNAIING